MHYVLLLFNWLFWVVVKVKLKTSSVNLKKEIKESDFSQQDGKKETDFLDVIAWRNTAEFAAKYFMKGRMAVISGRLQIRNWEDKEGNKRRTAEILAENIYFGDSKKDDDGGSASAPAQGFGAPAQSGGFTPNFGSAQLGSFVPNFGGGY